MWSRTGKLFAIVLYNVLYAWKNMLTSNSYYPEFFFYLYLVVLLTFDVLFRGLSGRHVAQAQLMHSCLAAVKASMLVVQRSQEPISTGTQSDLHQALSGLLSCYTCILTDGKAKTTIFFRCKFTLSDFCIYLHFFYVMYLFL